jgi:hypothetical protein
VFVIALSCNILDDSNEDDIEKDTESDEVAGRKLEKLSKIH